MSIETVIVRPNGYTSPDLDLFSTFPAAMDSIDIANGNCSATAYGVDSVNDISFNFASFAKSDFLESVTLNLTLTLTGGVTASAIVMIKYGTGTWGEIGSYLDGINNISIPLSVVDPGTISIGVIFTGTYTMAGPVPDTISVTNLNITYTWQTANYRPLTVRDIANDLIEEYGDRTQSLKIVRIVERWIDEIYKKIINFCPWNFAHKETTIITEADESTYIVYDPVNNGTSLRFTDGSGPIRFRPRDVIVRSGYNIDQTGKPIWFYHQGFDDESGSTKIVLVPTPDTVYTLKLFGNPIPIHLTSDDIIPLPSSFVTALKDGARYYYSQRRGHPEDAQVHIQNFYNQLRDLAHEYKKLPASDDGIEQWTSSGGQSQSPMGEWFPGGGW